MRTQPVTLVLAGTLVTSVLAGCSSGGAQGESAAGSVKSISIAAGYMPATTDLDPRDSASQQVAPTISQSLAGTLFSYNGLPEDPNSSAQLAVPQPELAESATLSADGLTWTLKLRAGVKSQAGNAFTAEDVVWTVQRALATKAIASNLLTQTVPLDPAKPVTALDAMTVQFNLSRPSSVLEQVFSLPWLGIFDSKAVKANAAPADPWGYEWLNTHSASYGPYEVSVSELPQRLVVKASPAYWRGPAKIESATFVIIAEDSTRLQAGLTGQVDIAAGLASTNIKAIRASSAVTAYVQPNALQQKQLGFSLASPEVSDVNMRRALSLAVDRKAIADTVYEGLATPITGCMPGLLYKATSPDDVQAGPDVEKAKALVAQASGPKTVTIGYLPDTGNVFPQILQTNFQAIGVKATLKPYTTLATWQADFKNGVFSVAVNGFAPFVNDPGYLLVNLNSGKAPSNRTGYANPVVDAASEKALSATGDLKQSSVATACRQLQQDVPMAPILSTGQLAAVSNKVDKVAAYQYAVLLYNTSFK
ncbi:MAG TPA: ABC transporter substrate-binding protein [Mycobacteriales bacterium]|jgi:peptide/nickel transport system substrate-binding protein|nr:ABC transporter substrate-binding protein [Mycobacteriales bacterium]